MLSLTELALTGSLPASWGAATAFQKMQLLQLDRCNITGDALPWTMSALVSVAATVSQQATKALCRCMQSVS